MTLKIRNRTFEVDTNDLILDNGACYILITQKIFKNYSHYSPTIPKSTFARLLKEDKIRLSEKKYKGYFGDEYDLYEFVEEENTLQTI